MDAMFREETSKVIVIEGLDVEGKLKELHGLFLDKKGTQSKRCSKVNGNETLVSAPASSWLTKSPVKQRHWSLWSPRRSRNGQAAVEFHGPVRLCSTMKLKVGEDRNFVFWLNNPKSYRTVWIQLVKELIDDQSKACNPIKT
ncbi:hypothetical protein ACH5RR_037541 [Cinchona calisaya]|uniref:Uncharacterized protein n=1 Tax=Cinchona calisaya TaxID=153742 RepID=A0ABD2Y9K1_9GENT